MRALGRLLRISLFPTVAADVAVGLFLGGADRDWLARADAWAVVLAVLGVYHGALCLNDWVDREHDARTRSERPIPSGRIPAGAALALALALIGAGIGAAWSADPRAGRWVAGLATCACAYDLFGRGALVGPALLGACRFGSLGFGLVAASWLDGRAFETPRLLVLPALYAAYVFFVSRLGRLEDEEHGAPLGSRPRTPLLLAACALSLVPASALVHGSELTWGLLASCVVAWSGAAALFSRALSASEWTPSGVVAAMGASLRRLLVFTAAAALLAPARPAQGLIVAGFVLLGYPLSFWLRRAFPPS